MFQQNYKEIQQIREISRYMRSPEENEKALGTHI